MLMQPGFSPGLPGSRGRIQDIQGMQSCAICSVLTRLFSPLLFLQHGFILLGGRSMCTSLCIMFIAVSVIPAVCLSGQALCLVKIYTEGLGYRLHGAVLVYMCVRLSIHDKVLSKYVYAIVL